MISAKAIQAIGDGFDGPFAGTSRPGAAGRGETPADRVVPCFTPGTMVTTRAGKRAVETLRPGDMLLTRDRGFQPVVWRGMRRVAGSALSAETAPVTIRAGALGPGQPERDMVVSPGHRMLSTDRDLLRGVGEPEALVEARALTGLPGIGRVVDGPVGYVHLLMEKHEVILAENTWTESLRLTPVLLRALSEAGVDIGQRLARSGDRAAATAQTPARHCLTVTEAAQGLRA
ncbi:MAG: Hint domain-containing protein [Roseovarius sp.]|uniref:Hint domain-containing protein n=1 Tax=Roseovarius sp. TaxID=1486281 RepID=UPI0032ED4332